MSVSKAIDEAALDIMVEAVMICRRDNVCLRCTMRQLFVRGRQGAALRRA